MIFGNRKITVWKREPNEFARRFEISDIKGLFRKHITIEHGTQSLFLQGGRFVGELPPGTYKDIGGVIKALKIDVADKATVILVDVGDVFLDLHIEELLTSESVHVGMSSNVTIQAEAQELNKLFMSLMKSRELLEIRDVKEFLEGEIKNILQAKIKDSSVKELYGNLELKNELEQDVEFHMRTTLERAGLKLVQVRAVEFEFPNDIKENIKRRGGLHTKEEYINIQEQDLVLKKRMLELEKNEDALDEEKRHLVQKRRLVAIEAEKDAEEKLRDGPIGTTLPPMPTPKKPSKTKGEKLIENFVDEVMRRRKEE